MEEKKAPKFCPRAFLASLPQMLQAGFFTLPEEDAKALLKAAARLKAKSGFSDLEAYAIGLTAAYAAAAEEQAGGRGNFRTFGEFLFEKARIRQEQEAGEGEEEEQDAPPEFMP